MKLNFKTRIALNYFFATGIVVALVFAIVFISLNTTIYESLDSDLNYESEVHLEELDLENMVFSNREEWEEREHEEVEVNPVFVQIINSEEKNPYKCIYFVDGYEQNPILGGATGLYNDNNFAMQQ